MSWKEHGKIVYNSDFSYSDQVWTVCSTKNGETVKSKKEKVIADYLHSQNISYVYEKTLNLDWKIIHPDFYLPQYNIYLEFWWLIKDKEYEHIMRFKMALYRNYGVDYISIYPYNIKDLKSLDYFFKKKLNEVLTKRQKADDFRSRFVTIYSSVKPKLSKRNESNTNENFSLRISAMNAYQAIRIFAFVMIWILSLIFGNLIQSTDVALSNPPSNWVPNVVVTKPAIPQQNKIIVVEEKTHGSAEISNSIYEERTINLQKRIKKIVMNPDVQEKETRITIYNKLGEFKFLPVSSKNDYYLLKIEIITTKAETIYKL